MPQVNGKNYRTFGQGYRAERAKAAEPSNQSVQDEPHAEDEGHEGGSIAHVKHHGGGKFSIKLEHHDGSSSNAKAESPEEMHGHLDQHFGTEDAEGQSAEGDEYEDGDEDSGEALKSILG